VNNENEYQKCELEKLIKIEPILVHYGSFDFARLHISEKHGFNPVGSYCSNSYILKTKKVKSHSREKKSYLKLITIFIK
jgi:hypothetical protein